MDIRARGFCFTLNNPDGFSKDELKDLKGSIYGVVGDEIGEGGTPHLQGYVYFKSAAKLKAVINKLKKACSKACHVEVQKGSAKQASDYCKKDGNFVEWGELPTQGKRRDLDHAKEMIDAGASLKQVADEHFGSFVRYHSGFTKYKAMVDKERCKDFRKVEVIFMTGPTGCGKTRKAMEEAEFKISGDQLKWWDGYEGEKTILIDEYANQCNITTLLNLLDGYQLRLEIKGGFTYAAWTKVYITSNLLVLHEHAKDEHREALQRRISKTINYWPASGLGVKRKRDEAVSSDFVV